jgi:hypothetical protein
MLPIHGVWAASFIARLIFRISEFIPEALNLKPLLTWREVVSGMLRMTYATELITIINNRAKLQLTSGDFDYLQFKANIWINNRRADWLQKLIAEIADKNRLSASEVKTIAHRWASMTDSLKYIQIGSPESIVITKDVDQASLAEHFAS